MYVQYQVLFDIRASCHWCVERRRTLANHADEQPCNKMLQFTIVNGIYMIRVNSISLPLLGWLL